MIKVVFFDATGTLIHLPRGVGFHYAAVARKLGVALEEEAINRAFREAWRTAARPRPGPRPDDDKGWWRDLVREVTDRAGEVPGRFEDFFEELYARFAEPGVWALFPEVAEVLRRLAPARRLAVISNFDGRLRIVLEHLGVCGAFEELIISSEVGANKPAPEIFLEACRRLGVEPKEALHVGDDPEDDWAGAASAGLHAFQLRRPEGSLLDLAAFLDEPDPGQPR